jgi:serine/threonine protein kinase
MFSQKRNVAARVGPLTFSIKFALPFTRQHQQASSIADLKPDNIWLEPNRLGSYRVKVLDFGHRRSSVRQGAPTADDDPALTIIDDDACCCALGERYPHATRPGEAPAHTLQ